MTSSTTSKVKTIVEDTGLSPEQVSTVLYSYLTWCIQEVLIQGYSQTIFGKLSLTTDNRLKLEGEKEGLIGLLDKHDIKIIQKIVENGNEYKIF